MGITRDNYELWFLDYLEGNLDERMIDDFLEFIRENPDLAEELQLFDSVSLPESKLFFSDRKKLYKEALDVPDNFDTMAVGFLEGDLDQDNQIYFSSYLVKHPGKNKELQLFRQIKLLPDTSIFFKNKQRLYRQPVIRLVASRLSRIAAVFIFIFALSQMPEKKSADEIPGNFLTIFTSDNQTVHLDDKKNGHTNPLVADLQVTGTVKPPEIPGKKYTRGKKPELLATHELQTPVDSARDNQPLLLSSAYSSPVYVIQTSGPELMTPSIFYEIAAPDEPVHVSLSDSFFQKIGLSGLNPGKVVRWGLSLAAEVTKEKFNYSTGASGEIIALNLDTRLVGFSIPVNKK